LRARSSKVSNSKRLSDVFVLQKSPAKEWGTEMNRVPFISRLRRWLNKTSIQDPIQRRLASLLQAILLGLIGVVVLATIFSVMNSTDTVQEKINGIRGNLFGFLVVALPLSLLRRGYFRISALIIIIILIITPTLAIIVVYDILNSGGILFQFTLAIILAGLLVSRRILILTFGLSAAVVGFAAFRGQNAAPQLVIAANFFLFNGLIALFVDRFGMTLRTALTDALARERELKIEMAERKQAEGKIAYQSHLLENVNDAVLAVDTEFNITSWNRAAEEMYGYKADEVLGQKSQAVIRLDFSDEQRADAVQALIESGSYRTEVLQYRRDGHAFWVEGSTFALKESDGQIYGYVSINRDISQRKQAEEQIQRQLKQLNALRTIDIAISSSFDLDVILEVVLQQVLSQLEVDATALLLLDPELQTIEYAASRGFRSEALRHTKLNLGEGYASQAVFARKTIHISALMETGGKLAKALLAANEDFVDYYGTPLIVKGAVKGVLELYHHSSLKPDAEWLEFLDILAGQAAIAINDAQLFENLQRSNIELEHRVIERTAQLNQTNIELERANRAKDEFLATMSHELRTPLTSILGLSETLLEQRRGPLNENQQKSLQIIESSGSHLLALINDILDLSKIEAGKFDFYPQPILVDEICRSSLAFIKSQAAKKSITIIYNNEATVSKIYADPRRLKQILVNLLINAVKFTSEGGEVILQVKTDLEQDLIKFSVIDNGIGIAPEDLQRLFQPFVQVDSRLNRQYEGTGLGLVLAQKLADLHGGSVQVESEVGKGSRFTINLACKQDEIAKLETLESQTTFPVNEPAEKIEPPAEISGPQGVILLADDSLSNIITIGDYLESHGYEVVIARDGLEAVEKAEEIQPDIILMDIQMPSMDGLEAMTRLRGKPQFVSTPIIALTALAMPGDRERCLLAGASEYMSKPVSLKALLQEIADLLKGRSSS
jgi:PAS domain S-box-containing protein